MLFIVCNGLRMGCTNEARDPLACYQAFDLFDTLPLEGDPHDAPPARPPPGWKERFTARQKVAGCLTPNAAWAPKVRREEKESPG